MRRLVLAILLLGASPSFAQRGPSFDCSKADNAIDHAICDYSKVARADRELAAAYAGLVGKLNGAAREELVKDQVRWITDRNRACLGDSPPDIANCLEERYGARVGNLRAFADGHYLFISEHALINRGKLGKITWSYDVAYPRFDGTTADFSALNARFADAAKKKADDATPTAGAGPEHEQQWTYAQNFTVNRPPGGNAVTIGVHFYGYSGGAHGYGATNCTLVDLRTGRAVGPDGVFAPGEQWLRVMSQIVGADLKKQFVEKPGFDDALEPANLAKLLSEPGHYCWRADRLELIFNAYEVGPYVSGPFEVYVPYERLKPLLRVDGPIAR